jgi:hypothetical protein
MMLAGPNDASDTLKSARYNVGNFGWSNGIVPADMPATSMADGSVTTLKRGTVVRVYVGTIPWSKDLTITTPNANGEYLIEPAGGGYWLGYVNTPETQALLNSSEYAAKLPALKKRVLAAKLAPKDLQPLSGDGTADNAANEALNAQGVYDPNVYEMDANGLPMLDKNGKPVKKKTDGGGGGGDKKGDSNTGLLALLGLGALAYFASQK